MNRGLRAAGAVLKYALAGGKWLWRGSVVLLALVAVCWLGIVAGYRLGHYQGYEQCRAMTMNENQRVFQIGLERGYGRGFVECWQKVREELVKRGYVIEFYTPSGGKGYLWADEFGGAAK